MSMSKNELLFLLVVLLLGLFLRSFFVTDLYLVDEADRINWANEPGFMNKLIEKTPTYSPLIYILLGSIHARVNDLPLERAIPLLLGCVVIVLGYFLARPFGLEKEMALFLAVAPHPVVYSVQLSSYIYLILLGLIHAYLFFVAKKHPRARMVIAGILAGLGFLFHYIFLAYIAAFVVYLLFSKENRGKIGYYLAGVAPFFLINLPTFIAQRQFNHFNDIFAFNIKSTLVTLAAIPHFTYSPILVAITLLTLWYIFKNKHKLDERIRTIMIPSALFLAFVFVSALLMIAGFIPRYIIVVQPLLFLILFHVLQKNLSPKYYHLVSMIYFVILGLTTLYIATRFAELGWIPLYY